MVDEAIVDLEYHLELLKEYEIKKKQEEAEMERKMLLDSDVCDLETKKSFAPGSEVVDLSELARSEIKRSGVSLS